MGSTRLPGKALRPILHKPLLCYAIETLKRSPVIDRIVLAIPDSSGNEPLFNFACQNRIDIFTGSESNVLKRFYDASRIFEDDIYFRATGDNPIIDYNNPKRSLDVLLKENLDYAAESGLPVGSIVEVFTRDALERTYIEGKSPEDIEHVTWYMKKSGKFKIRFFPAPPELTHPGIRLTVDYEEDFKRVTTIIETLYKDEIPPFKAVVDFVTSSQLY